MGAYQDAKFGFGVFFGCAELMKHSQFLSYTSYNPQDLPERWDIDLNALSELSWNSRSTPRALQEHSQSSHASQLLISSLHAISEIPIIFNLSNKCNTFFSSSDFGHRLNPNPPFSSHFWVRGSPFLEPVLKMKMNEFAFAISTVHFPTLGKCIKAISEVEADGATENTWPKFGCLFCRKCSRNK